ncbi:MAG: hypothetical protein WD716_03085 [Fimbriimonadaceae bacterium]
MLAAICLLTLSAAQRPQLDPERDFILLPSGIVQTYSGTSLPPMPNGYRKGTPIPAMPGAGTPLIDREEPVGRSYYAEPPV